MKIKNTFLIMSIMVAAAAANFQNAQACTGITLTTTSGAIVPARTIEWAGGDIGSLYQIVPRGYVQRSLVPGGDRRGMTFKARYGYVGLAVAQPEYVVDGMNEAGLVAGLFYFPGYGSYEPYDEHNRSTTINDFQLVSWILSRFATVDEVRQAIAEVHVVAVDPRSSTVHWRVVEPSGKQIVIEIVDGQARVYDNPIGVLTNSPGFEWHLTNLNNYVNLQPGKVQTNRLGNVEMNAFGGGSGMHGLPGDFTPPSRFVRAAMFQATAPRLDDSQATVMQAFHILNNFDIPVGIQFATGEAVPDVPSATQWTVASDISQRKIYYRTMYNSNVRCISLADIDFGKVSHQYAPLDPTKHHPVENVKIK